ncbi:hypothetical protein PYCC9005_001120 [Savitreella phatthalungensis]
MAHPSNPMPQVYKSEAHRFSIPKGHFADWPIHDVHEVFIRRDKRHPRYCAERDNDKPVDALSDCSLNAPVEMVCRVVGKGRHANDTADDYIIVEDIRNWAVEDAECAEGADPLDYNCRLYLLGSRCWYKLETAAAGFEETLQQMHLEARVYWIMRSVREQFIEAALAEYYPDENEEIPQSRRISIIEAATYKASRTSCKAQTMPYWVAIKEKLAPAMHGLAVLNNGADFADAFARYILTHMLYEDTVLRWSKTVIFSALVYRHNQIFSQIWADQAHDAQARGGISARAKHWGAVASAKFWGVPEDPSPPSSANSHLPRPSSSANSHIPLPSSSEWPSTGTSMGRARPISLSATTSSTGHGTSAEPALSALTAGTTPSNSTGSFKRPRSVSATSGSTSKRRKVDANSKIIILPLKHQGNHETKDKPSRPPSARIAQAKATQTAMAARPTTVASGSSSDSYRPSTAGCSNVSDYSQRYRPNRRPDTADTADEEIAWNAHEMTLSTDLSFPRRSRRARPRIFYGRRRWAELLDGPKQMVVAVDTSPRYLKALIDRSVVLKRDCQSCAGTYDMGPRKEQLIPGLESWHNVTTTQVFYRPGLSRATLYRHDRNQAARHMLSVLNCTLYEETELVDVSLQDLDYILARDYGGQRKLLRHLIAHAAFELLCGLSQTDSRSPEERHSQESVNEHNFWRTTTIYKQLSKLYHVVEDGCRRAIAWDSPDLLSQVEFEAGQWRAKEDAIIDDSEDEAAFEQRLIDDEVEAEVALTKVPRKRVKSVARRNQHQRQQQEEQNGRYDQDFEQAMAQAIRASTTTANRDAIIVIDSSVCGSETSSRFSPSDRNTSSTATSERPHDTQDLSVLLDMKTAVGINEVLGNGSIEDSSITEQALGACLPATRATPGGLEDHLDADDIDWWQDLKSRNDKEPLFRRDSQTGSRHGLDATGNRKEQNDLGELEWSASDDSMDDYLLQLMLAGDYSKEEEQLAMSRTVKERSRNASRSGSRTERPEIVRQSTAMSARSISSKASTARNDQSPKHKRASASLSPRRERHSSREISQRSKRASPQAGRNSDSTVQSSPGRERRSSSVTVSKEPQVASPLTTIPRSPVHGKASARPRDDTSTVPVEAVPLSSSRTGFPSPGSDTNRRRSPQSVRRVASNDQGSPPRLNRAEDTSIGSIDCPIAIASSDGDDDSISILSQSTNDCTVLSSRNWTPRARVSGVAKRRRTSSGIIPGTKIEEIFDDESALPAKLSGARRSPSLHRRSAARTPSSSPERLRDGQPVKFGTTTPEGIRRQAKSSSISVGRTDAPTTPGKRHTKGKLSHPGTPRIRMLSAAVSTESVQITSSPTARTITQMSPQSHGITTARHR